MCPNCAQRWDRIGIVSLVLSRFRREESVMAVLKKRGGVYRIDFRFAGRRFRQSLKTDNERAARNAVSNRTIFGWAETF
jgi:hypothetical protein